MLSGCGNGIIWWMWHCSSTYLDGVFMGARNRLLPTGTELERLPLPEALQGRLADTMERVRAIR